MLNFDRGPFRHLEVDNNLILNDQFPCAVCAVHASSKKNIRLASHRGDEIRFGPLGKVVWMKIKL